MKAKFLIALVVLSGLFTSCKNEKQEGPSTEKTESTDANFKVVVTAIVSEKDDFQLFFSEDPLGVPFKEENSLWAGVKPSPEPQEIVFTIPDGRVPNFLRLDLGINDKQKDIVIKNFKMSYNQKNFQANDSLFFKYFIPNGCIQIVDKAKAQVKPIKMPDGVYDPIFYTENGLLDEIKKLGN